MFQIRPQQVEALCASRRTEFEERLHAHLSRCFRAVTRRMSDAELLEVIRHGVTRASGYGIESELGICRYLNLMFVFGRDFDRNPRLSWAREILDGARIHRSLSRIDHLCHEAEAHLAHAQGLGSREAA